MTLKDRKTACDADNKAHLKGWMLCIVLRQFSS